MNGTVVVITSLMVSFIAIMAAFTVSQTMNDPGTISPETPASFANYVDNTVPTGHGFFNASMSGSTAEFAYTFTAATNATVLKLGYVLGIQVSVSIVREHLGLSGRGFGATVSNAFENYGEQHFKYLSVELNSSGHNEFPLEGQAFGPNNHISIFIFAADGSAQNLYSTFNISFTIVPVLLQGPFATIGPPHAVNEELEVQS